MSTGASPSMKWHSELQACRKANCSGSTRWSLQCAVRRLFFTLYEYRYWGFCFDEMAQNGLPAAPAMHPSSNEISLLLLVQREQYTDISSHNNPAAGMTSHLS